MKKYFFLILFFAVIFLSGIGNLSAQRDCIPGSYNQTHFCNIDKDFELLGEDGVDCLNDYECLTGACTHNFTAGRTICESKYKAIREQTNFLQDFWNRFVEFITGGDFNPQVSFVSPTTGDTNFISPTTGDKFLHGIIQDFIEANISVFELNPSDNYTIYLYNSTGLVDKTEGSQLPLEVSFFAFTDFADLPTDEIYHLNATVEDASGDVLVQTETREIWLVSSDVLPPTIIISNPQEAEEYPTFDNDLEYYVYDPYLDSCWYSLDEGVTNSSPDASCPSFEGLLGVEGSNKWKVYANDTAGNEVVASVVFTIRIPDILPPVVSSFTPPTENTYFPDSVISFSANISDDNNDISWRVISDIQGGVASGSISESGGSVSPSFSLLPSQIGASQDHIITFNVTDAWGNFNDGNTFPITLKNENCTDAVDNDGDFISDGLDIDCSGEVSDAEAISIRSSGVTVFSNNALTHRRVIVDCKYNSTSLDIRGIEECVKLDVAGNACLNPEANLAENKTKFRGCSVGGTGIENAEVRCYIDTAECNAVGLQEEFGYINISKFSSCDYGDVRENTLFMDLEKPREEASYDVGDIIFVKVDVENLYVDNPYSDFMMEIWLFDITQELLIESNISEVVRIQRGDSRLLTTGLLVLGTAISGNENRLYYKIYTRENFICSSESISVRINDEGSVDFDDDGYGEENDCDDFDNAINPGEDEICSDDIDNDCDGDIDGLDSDCFLSDQGIVRVGRGQINNFGTLTTRGQRVLMGARSRADFKIRGEQHSVLVKDIAVNSSTLTVSSASFDILLRVLQTKDVDLDGDGKDDLRLTMNGISGDEIDITFRSLFRETPSPTTKDPGPGEPPKGNFIFKLLASFILILIVFLVILMFYLKKKKEAKTNFGRPRPVRIVRRPANY